MDDDSGSCITPNSLDELVGQTHLFAKNKPLYTFYHSDSVLPSMILYGPPGTGKTTYAKLLSKQHKMDFVHLNATQAESRLLRETLKKSPVLIVVDEIHRFDKRQQDILLPYLENHDAVMIGTSTYNPYFKLTKALRSRCFLYEFKPLSAEDLKLIAKKALRCFNKEIAGDVLDLIVMYSAHDARKLIKTLEMMKNSDITEESIKSFLSIDTGYANETERYDLISAFIKSIRGSDIDASVYYLARLIKAKEDPEFIARRLCILASEDIGLADSNAVNIASSTLNIVKDIGLPECAINLAHCCIYLAKAKKSNSSYMAVKKAMNDVEQGVIMDVPEHLKSHPTKPYLYPHNYKNSRIKQEYTQRKIKYFEKKENDLI